MTKQAATCALSAYLLFLGASVFLTACSTESPAGTDSGADRPRLVLQLTVDQLRGDLPMRYHDRFGDGGFRYLWDSGIVFRDAHHAHANTETIVGHATLATGTHPSIHGMIGNVWFDRSSGFTTYNIEDADYHLLTRGAGVDAGTEIDPTQRAARSEGRSPASILTTTISDELRSSTAGQSKSIAVSVKDRGAVAMAGHSGTAYWFSKSSGEFVSSDYYLEQYPEWVDAFNAAQPASAYAGTSWELSRNASEYLHADTDDRPWEIDLAGFGRVFPHAFGDGDSPYFTTLLTVSPAGDELVLEFAKRALVEEQLGKDDITDYLSVSFSSTDYVGHLFGASSLEAEDNLIRLDRVLADLLDHIDAQVGLDNTLIVLSSDHGGADTPGYLNSMGIPAGYVDPSTWESEAAIGRVKERFDIRGELIEKYEHPYVYLHADVRDDPRIDAEDIERAVADELAKFHGVSLAVSSTALAHGNLPDTHLYRAVLNNFHQKRSGDVFIVFEPNWFINDMEGLTVASTHGSPWQYDSYVPIVFAGMDFAPRIVDRRVQTVDVAATIAAYLDIRAPSGSVGIPLAEVLH